MHACQLLASCACADLPPLSRGTGIGHGHFHDCVTAVSLAIRNPGNEELSISAIKLMQTISKRLAESDPQVSVPNAVNYVRAGCSCSDGIYEPQRRLQEVA